MPPKRRSSGPISATEPTPEIDREAAHAKKQQKVEEEKHEEGEIVATKPSGPAPLPLGHEPSKELRFYKTAGRYGFLSNFSKHPVTMGKTPYYTSEHAYQAGKARNPNDAEMIRLAQTPMAAKKLAQKCEIREGWEASKVEFMRTVLIAKLRSNPELVDLLLETGERKIIEDSPKDYFWGCGATGDGENHLGRLWMQIRKVELDRRRWLAFASPKAADAKPTGQ